ncbi:VOC family protein [uncultured Sphaerochaeta sp.]|uniref:VOC family protein n=1 Tax=uncultured Sphaerochaeta sp. TaxID=886478 RepID=UPI002A0A3660|nr:VOC family protein [uncultured Sphaerochaeta sp.]
MSLKSIVSGIQHIGIPTNDLESTLSFYEKLGFEIAYETTNGSEKVAFLKLGSIVIETYQNGKATRIPGAIDHIALDVNDIDKAYSLIREKGFTELEDGMQTLPFWANGVKFFTILGPNQEKVEFSQML